MAGKIALYALTLIAFALMLVSVPRGLKLSLDASLLVAVIIPSAMLCVFTALLTIVSVAEVAFTDIVIIVLLCFAGLTAVVGFPVSLGGLLFLFYAYRVKVDSNNLKRPDPGHLSFYHIPFLMFILAVFAGLVVFLYVEPRIGPELFSGMDQYSETIIGCKPNVTMVDCMNELVRAKSDYTSVVGECNGLPFSQKQACIAQVDVQVRDLVNQTLVQYSKTGKINATVAEYLRDVSAGQMNSLFGKDKNVVRVMFAFGAFSVISGLGGVASILTSNLASIFLSVLLMLKVVTTITTQEEITHFELE